MSASIRPRYRVGLVALVVVLAGCSEDDTSVVGVGQLPAVSDTIQELILEPVLAESFASGTADRGFGTLLVAAHDLPDPAGFESRILIRFGLTVADTAQGPVRVDSTLVRLVISDQRPDSIAFRLHRVNETWTELEAAWDERLFDVPWSQPGGAVDPTPLIEGVLAGDSVSFPLPDSLVQGWLDEPATNDGVILLLETPGSFVRIPAASTTTLLNEGGPRLRLFLTVSDSASVSNVAATADAHIAVFEGAIPPGLAAGNEPFLRSLLLFDLSAVPPEASINLAELRLTPRQVVAPLDSLRIELRRVTSSPLGGATVFSTGVLASNLAQSDSALTFSSATFAALVRAWQREPDLNQGVGLVAERSSANLGFAVYAGPEAAAAERPRLRVIFTPPLVPDVGRASR